MNKHLYISFFFISIIGYTYAQRPTRFIGIGTSMASYKGDLSGYEKFSSAFEFSIIQNKEKRIKSILNLSAGKVIAQTTEKVYTKLDYSPLQFVQTNFLSISYTLNYFILDKEHFKSYFGIGFGLFQFKPKDEFGNEIFSISHNTRPDNETYVLTKINIPIQFGFIYTLKNNFGLQTNIKWLNPNTDYLDNMSALANTSTKDNIFLVNFSVLIPMKEPEKKQPELQ